VVLPHRERGSVARFLQRPLADQVLDRLPEIEVHVVGTKLAPEGRGTARPT